LSYEGICFFIN